MLPFHRTKSHLMNDSGWLMDPFRPRDPTPEWLRPCSRSHSSPGTNLKAAKINLESIPNFAFKKSRNKTKAIFTRLTPCFFTSTPIRPIRILFRLGQWGKRSPHGPGSLDNQRVQRCQVGAACFGRRRVVKLWSISTRLKDPFQATLMRSPDAISRELITCDQKILKELLVKYIEIC